MPAFSPKTGVCAGHFGIIAWLIGQNPLTSVAEKPAPKDAKSAEFLKK
jgi:hypothetical protein